MEIRLGGREVPADVPGRNGRKPWSGRSGRTPHLFASVVGGVDRGGGASVQRAAHRCPRRAEEALQQGPSRGARQMHRSHLVPVRGPAQLAHPAQSAGTTLACWRRPEARLLYTGLLSPPTNMANGDAFRTRRPGNPRVARSRTWKHQLMRRKWGARSSGVWCRSCSLPLFSSIWTDRMSAMQLHSSEPICPCQHRRYRRDHSMLHAACRRSYTCADTDDWSVPWGPVRSWGRHVPLTLAPSRRLTACGKA